jgi:hypothetical protein
MSNDDKPRRGCLRILGWGCGCLALAVVLLVAAVYLGKDLVKEMGWYKSLEGAAEQARADMEVAMAISAELEARWPAEDISMSTHTSFGSEAGKFLTIRILNPELPFPEDEGEAVAREIAEFTASRFPGIETYDALTVEVHRFRDGFTSQQRYPFRVDMLVPDDVPESGMGTDRD